MDINKVEISVVEKILSDVNESQVRELSELQLALIGGGIGETVL